ncbi:putative cation transporter [Leptomonas seymouri]|uniref:Putative cation transporter n=1 Tax=Leptomonas seymouri TaxID=5684 RepID=A0A0N1PB11_LEPSE|nr:putative cation transporter [Leptomonas seymouri]|eukprot:KPI85164.1 putative cation transporter [Leptomonas seymouri]
MQSLQPLLGLVASACVVVMYRATSATGTSFLWLSSFCALAAFFVRAASNNRFSFGGDGLNCCCRINSIVAFTLLFTSFQYGLKTLGPLRFILVAACVAGLPRIMRCRKGHRFAKLVCTTVCSAILMIMTDPGQRTPPSLIYGAIGILCTTLAGRVAVSAAVKTADMYSLLFTAIVLGIAGFLVTVAQYQVAAPNEMRILLIYCISAAVFFGCIALGLVAKASIWSLTVVLAGVLGSSLLCGTAVLPPLKSWELPALVIASLALLGAHKGINFCDVSSTSDGSVLLDPAQLFKKLNSHPNGGGIIVTIMSNSRERKLFVFLLLTTSIMVLEFLYGVAANSLGLISDSFHMMLDGTSIAIGLYAAHAASWQPDEKTHPFGYARYEVFGGFMNGILLLFIALYVTVESIQRIIDPPEIEGPYLLLVSVIGLVVNIVGVVFFHEAHGHSHSHSHGEGGSDHVDHNMRGVYLHILADLLGSVSVIISSVIIYFFDLWIADPICSALSAVLILLSAFPLLEETGKVLLLCAPECDRNYSDMLRLAILETGLLQDVGTPTIWVHSTPPRELTICTVVGKIRSDGEYASTRKKLIETISQHMMRHLNVYNVTVIFHME